MVDPNRPDFANTPASNGRASFGYSPIDLATPPTVSIITPLHNAGAVFHETARSVLQQSFQQWEWLIVNDCSDDPTSITILDSYRQQDARIRVIDHPVNQGLSAARNTGFRAARTPYVVQLDSDDLLEPTAIEKWFWFLESHPEFAFVKGYSVGFGAQQYLWNKGFHCGPAFLEDNPVAPTSMIRKSVHQAAGGYDENNRQGLEDWDFWLRCANLGHWGGTIPEYLDWYRRRPSHSEKWTNWDGGDRQAAFRAQLRQKYPQLWDVSFPQIRLRPHEPGARVPDDLPCQNHLRKEKPRLLMVVPWLEVGGADKFNIDVLQQLTIRGWEVTVATTLYGEQPWLPEFSRLTPDVFVLPHLLRLVDYPRFLRYLIQSRNIDIVLITHSQFGYLLLPYLRAHCPSVTFVDFCHIQIENWKNGGYPQMAIKSQELLDLNIVSSAHLKSWMVDRGADADRIAICYTNVDSNEWRPDHDQHLAVRREMGLDTGVPVILYAGRICPQKQPRVFAETMRRLRDRSSNFVALVAGDGPDLPWLRAFLYMHHLNDHVRLLGAVSNTRIRQLLAAADIFFLPSEWEGIAVAIYEAMSAGLPIVGANVGGQDELVTKDCGFLISRDDEATEAQHYASALTTLLDDPLRRSEMGKASQRRIQANFGIDKMANRMLELFYEGVILHDSVPRPLPSLAIGRLCASQAVEIIRLESEWHGLLNPDATTLRTLLYYTVKRAPFGNQALLLVQSVRQLLLRGKRIRGGFPRGLRPALVIKKRLSSIQPRIR